ncbi:MAG: protein kinase [Gemmatimonadaceae bacterium]
MPEPLQDLPAALSDRYRIERALGAGGMATVYLAQDLKHQRMVAVKVLRDDLTASLGKERFLREIAIAASLTHPHVLPLHDSGEAAGRLYYVMPYVDGPSLREKLRHDGRLPIADAVRVLRDVADAMAYAHKRGVVHRDLKPENVMLAERHALVTDFGVAKALTEATGQHVLTTAGVALGTPAYMSPEQATADPNIDHRSDIYAFGVMAYELLIGRTPFAGSSPQEVLAAHVGIPAAPVSQHRASIPPALAELVMRCLEKSPADRPQSADELIPVLEAMQTPGGGTVPVTRSAVPRRLSVAAGVLVILTVAAGGYAWRSARQAPGAASAKRVAVMRFENRTGVDSLDALGLMIADVITNDLSRSAAVDIAPTSTVMAVQAAKVNGANTSDPRFVAQETDAGLVVAGHYFRQGDSLAIQAQIVDAATNSQAAPIGLVTVPMARQREALGAIRDRVVVALSARLDPLLGNAAKTELPQSLDAYRELMLGLELQRQNNPAQALVHFYRSRALDSSSAKVLLELSMAEWNANQAIGRSDSLLRLLAPRRASLPAGDAVWYDYMRAWVDGDIEEQFRQTTRMLELSPVWAQAQEAYRTNRWSEAARRAQLSLRHAVNRLAPRMWEFYTVVLHHAGDYENELRAARDGLRESGETPAGIGLELRALAALGRMDDVRTRLSALQALERFDPYLLRGTAYQLRYHGHAAGADEIDRQAVEWYRGKIAKKTVLAFGPLLGVTLFDLGQVDQATSIFEQVLASDSSNVDALGWLGVVAVRRNDREAAERYVARLGALTTPYLGGTNIAWQGRIAAQLGACDRAVGYFVQALRRGAPYTEYWEDAPGLIGVVDEHLLDPIKDCAAFKEFMKPRD